MATKTKKSAESVNAETGEITEKHVLTDEERQAIIRIAEIDAATAAVLEERAALATIVKGSIPAGDYLVAREGTIVVAEVGVRKDLDATKAKALFPKDTHPEYWNGFEGTKVSTEVRIANDLINPVPTLKVKVVEA